MKQPDLLKFARLIFELSDWPQGEGIDGDAIQEAAIGCGLLIPETRTEPCGENCHCAEYYGSDDMKDGVVCYRKHPILKELEVNPE